MQELRQNICHSKHNAVQAARPVRLMEMATFVIMIHDVSNGKTRQQMKQWNCVPSVLLPLLPSCQLS